ncbi:hypothetical protein V8E51_003975 [Hyaloscypha variabilis]
MSPYCYHPLLPGPDKIRLLRLKPDEDETALVQCELFNYSLEKSTKGTHLYEALSYVWGDPEETVPIHVDGNEFPVTVKLHEALLCLRDRSIERIIWVDAVCINQNDDTEKTHEIGLMPKIYGQTNRVIIWLGAAADDSDLAIEAIRLAGSKKSTNSSDETIQQAIVALLERAWFQRIWVLQEVAAARHVLVMCGSMEIDGYAFCLGVELLKRYYDARPDLQGLIGSVTYLIKGAIFRPKHATNWSGRSSLDICPLGELIDRYHTHEATKLHDKVYALLGMSSDDLKDTDLLLGYEVLWEDLLQRLAKFLLGDKVSVEAWPDTEGAVIKSKGRVLGRVSLEKSSIASEDGHDVDIIFQNTLAQPGYGKEWSAHWTLHSSAKSIRDGDLVCLLDGSPKPTIIRPCKDHFVVITIAATPTVEIPAEIGHIEWPELLRSIKTFPRNFLLVWDWKKSPERRLDGDDESFLEINSRVPKGSKTYSEDDLDKATRIWDCVVILTDSEMDDKTRNILEPILESSTSITPPEKLFDKLYITILSRTIRTDYTSEKREEVCSALKHILGSVVVLCSQLSAYALAKLLHITKQEVDQTLQDLDDILDIPEDQTRLLRLYHPSFRKFLLSKDRCIDLKFWVDEKQAHRILVESCIRLMSTTLKQDICGVGTQDVLATDIKRSQLEQCLPSEVQYACLYWVQHLQKSDIQLYDNDLIHRFLQTHLLHWLEALSWMQNILEGVQAILSLESISLTSDSPRLHSFIYDIKQFALYFRSTLKRVPIQIYSIALVSAPANSIVRNQFEDQIPKYIQKSPGVQKNWSPLIQTLEGHSGWVQAVAFSPDAKQLASGSRDRTVRLWDTATGAVLQMLEGCWDTAECAVVFSPDGKQLASVAADRTVIWDMATGAALQMLEGHTDWVRAVAFSPDGKQLASAADDQTVKLWDTATGAALQTLEGHSARVKAVAFSPDFKQLAWGSHDGTVRLWDAATGAALQTLEGHSGWVQAVAFSPDGKQLASGGADRTVRLWDAATGAAL